VQQLLGIFSTPLSHCWATALFMDDAPGAIDGRMPTSDTQGNGTDRLAMRMGYQSTRKEVEQIGWRCAQATRPCPQPPLVD
jgi:hypothetical protein